MSRPHERIFTLQRVSTTCIKIANPQARILTIPVQNIEISTLNLKTSHYYECVKGKRAEVEICVRKNLWNTDTKDDILQGFLALTTCCALLYRQVPHDRLPQDLPSWCRRSHQQWRQRLGYQQTAVWSMADGDHSKDIQGTGHEAVS